MAEPRSWSGIPMDLAFLVLCRLPDHVDRIRFSAVCSHWRTAARDAGLPAPPLLALPDGTVYSLPSDRSFRLPCCAGYTDAGGNWLVFWSEDDGGYYILVDPFSNATMALPALSRACLRQAHGGPQDAGKDLNIHKLMFCSPRLVTALVISKRCNRIAVCQPGVSSWWTVRIGDAWWPWFVDIAFYGEKLYAIDYPEGDLYSMNIITDKGTGDPWISRVRRVVEGRFPKRCGDGGGRVGSDVVMKTMYLAGSRGDLLVVLRTTSGVVRSARGGDIDLVDVADRRNMFKVFRADFERSRWAEVTTLGDDQVLFLRRRCCRSVCASQIGVPGDCIVFFENDDEDRHWYDEESSSSCSVYSMKSGSVSTFLPTVSWRRGTELATWLFPKY